MRLIKSSLSGFTKYLFLSFLLYPWGEAFAWSGRYSGWHMGPGMMGFADNKYRKKLFCRQIQCSGYP